MKTEQNSNGEVTEPEKKNNDEKQKVKNFSAALYFEVFDRIINLHRFLQPILNYLSVSINYFLNKLVIRLY